MSRLLTISEVAERLRVSTGTVFSLARREGLPLIRVSPRRYLVSEEGLATWLDGRVVSGDRDPSIRSKTGATGESLSRFPRTPDDGARNGSTGRRRPPAATSRASNVVSIAGSPQKKAS